MHRLRQGAPLKVFVAERGLDLSAHRSQEAPMTVVIGERSRFLSKVVGCRMDIRAQATTQRIGNRGCSGAAPKQPLDRNP